MRLRNLLLTAFLLFPTKANSQKNYELMSYQTPIIEYSIPGIKNIKTIYKGPYIINPTSEYSDTNQVEVSHIRKNLKGEILPITNKICAMGTLLEKERQSIENTLLSIITTDPLILDNFNTFISNNILSIEENDSLRSLLALQDKTAIAYHIREKLPNHLVKSGPYGGYYEYPNILYFGNDSTEFPINIRRIREKDLLSTRTPTDLPIQEKKTITKKDSTEPKPKKLNWRDFLSRKKYNH